MKIKEYTSRHRNDFSAIMECEGCGSTCKLTTGYDDDNYHTRVIPRMKCEHCGKSSEEMPVEKSEKSIDLLLAEIERAASEDVMQIEHRTLLLEASTVIVQVRKRIKVNT
jgi:C4-type Zn-finger protein